ncbi:uncharacterized protein LOC127868126 [Dreissena polymorpha]|nr:uncharacterized protein LOC127868126 [Dreissena polymorpha]
MLYIEDDETNIIVHHIEPCDPGAPVPPCPGLLEDLMTYLKEIPLEEIEIPDELITKVRANWRKLDKAVVSLTALAKEYCEELFVRDPVYRHKISDVRCNRRLYLPRITEMLAGSDPEPRKVFCQILLKQLDIQTLKLVSDNLDLKKIEHFRKYSALARLEHAVQQFCEVASPTEKHDSLSDEFRQTRRCVNNTVIATSATALVGGVLAVAGILVTPVAAGLSLGLTLSGGVIGCVSAATQSGFRIHEAVKEKRVVAGIEKELMASERAVEKSMAEVCELFSDFHDISLKGKPASTETSLARGAFSVGSIFRSMHSFVGVAVSTASVGAGAAVATASVFGPIGLLLDVGLMAEAIRNKVRGNRTKAGKALECLGAFQTVFGALLRGNVDTSVNIIESPSFAAVDRRLSKKYSTM